LQAIERPWRNGSSLAGCSAGAMAMSNHVPNFFHPKENGNAGFAIVTDLTEDKEVNLVRF
jgi:cyanophycinase-like exopeptidase